MQVPYSTATSLALHGSVLLALITASGLSSPSLPDPAPQRPCERITFVLDGRAAARAGTGPILSLPPPPSGGRSKPGAVPAPRAAQSELPVEHVPHLEAPDELPEPAEIAGEPSLEGSSEADEIFGEPGGSSGGQRGGTPGGDPAGAFGGGGGGLSGGSGYGTGDGAGGAIYIDGSVTPPELIRRILPAYPQIARQSRTEATLLLRVRIGAEGEVQEVTILRSHPLFDRAALEAVKQWRYRPALQNGRRVKVYLLVTVEFRLL